MGHLVIGIIGFGRMGRKHLKELKKSGLWRIKYICDLNPEKAAEVAEVSPGTIFTTCEDDIFKDSEVD